MDRYFFFIKIPVLDLSRVLIVIVLYYTYYYYFIHYMNFIEYIMNKIRICCRPDEVKV